MKTRLLTVVLVPLLWWPCQSSTGQVTGGAAPDSSSYEAITRFLAGEVKEGRIAGAVGRVTVDGKERYRRAVGYADLESQRPMQESTLFRIASMTKAVTSTAVMQLVESGRIGLDDRVSDFLPAFREVEVRANVAVPSKAARPPTIRELLTHTSGIVYGWFGPEIQKKEYSERSLNDLFTPQKELLSDRIDRLAAVPLAFAPGEQWSYGLGVDVLGRIVEVVSGQSLASYFESEIFSPLGMSSTWFYVPEAQQSRLATLYTVEGDDSRLLAVNATPVSRGPLRFSSDYCLAGKGRLYDGGSGLVSTLGDYLRFLEIFLHEGGGILGPASVTAMMTNQIGDKTVAIPGHGDGFGYGFGVLTERGRADDPASVGTVSWGGIFNTYYWVDPAEEMIGILMTQIFPFDHLETRQEFKRLAYEALGHEKEEAK